MKNPVKLSEFFFPPDKGIVEFGKFQNEDVLLEYPLEWLENKAPLLRRVNRDNLNGVQLNFKNSPYKKEPQKYCEIKVFPFDEPPRIYEGRVRCDLIIRQISLMNQWEFLFVDQDFSFDEKRILSTKVCEMAMMESKQFDTHVPSSQCGVIVMYKIFKMFRREGVHHIDHNLDVKTIYQALNIEFHKFGRELEGLGGECEFADWFCENYMKDLKNEKNKTTTF